jgi:serine/threonine protein kinase/tetratricopeptide (TPR) repeat protein
MTPERWQQVSEGLDKALHLSTARRLHYLAEIAASDPELHREIESLLQSHHEAGAEFLNLPALQTPQSTDREDQRPVLLGRRLGAYQIVEQIGVGGMGEVYRAFRADDQYSKQVAIKVVRGGHDSAFVIRRFKNERQILANLDHPNIARLLDGGTAGDGAPYFVMELIEGESIDQYCDHHKQGIGDRLRLFLEVCSAVQFAHQRLIVHRDLKPGNILVTADGTPKLLDFGIAKILDPEAATETCEPTLTQFRALTPSYASPEQIKGEPITTASDVYSLGVILYELLSGHHPYIVAGDTPEKAARAVCELEPKRPSSVVLGSISASHGHSPEPGTTTSARTSENAEKLRKGLRGDLDNIVLMALRKEPQRRYSSVEQFAQDIRRHLENLPVIARKDTARYRASKFMKRHKAGVSATAGVAVIVLAALGVTLHEARIAQGRFNDVRRLANSMISEVHDSIAKVPGTTAARKLIAQRSLDYLDRLSQDAGRDRSLQGELATAYVKVGDVQGQSYYANLGDSVGALVSYRKALAIRETLAADDPGNLAKRLDLAQSYNKVGEMLAKMGDQSNASANYQKALPLVESLVAQDSSSLDNGNELVLTLTRFGYLLEDMGNLPGALVRHRAAVATGEKLLATHPADPLACHDLATAYNNVGDLLAKSGNARDGLEIYRKGLGVCTWVSPDDPNSTQANTRGWVDDYLRMGEMLTQLGNKKEAFENLQKAMSIARRLSAADPQNAQARSDLSACYQSIGDSQVAFGDATRALENYHRSIIIRQELSAEDVHNVEAQVDLASSYAKLAQVYMMLASRSKAAFADRAARWLEARSYLQKSLKLWNSMRQSGTLPGSEASQPDETAREIARCDAELEKLKIKNRSPHS